jgi:hypothetical protein
VNPRLIAANSVAHDPDYRAAKKDFETFVETLTPKIAGVDSTVPELPVKDLVMPLNPVDPPPLTYLGLSHSPRYSI